MKIKNCIYYCKSLLIENNNFLSDTLDEVTNLHSLDNLKSLLRTQNLFNRLLLNTLDTALEAYKQEIEKAAIKKSLKKTTESRQESNQEVKSSDPEPVPESDGSIPPLPFNSKIKKWNDWEAPYLGRSVDS